MNEQRDKDFVRHSIDSGLSSIKSDPRLAQRIIASEEEKPVVKKMATSFIVVLALMAITITAFAATLLWKDAGEKVAPLESRNGYYDTWNPEAKIELVKALIDLGELKENADAERLLNDSSMSAEEKEALCDQIMTSYVNGEPDTVTLLSILEKLRGDMSTWSMEDLVWYNDLLQKNDMLSDEDENYVLPIGGELTEEQAIQTAKDFLIAKGAQGLKKAQIEAMMTEANDGLRTWSITFRPDIDNLPYGGACNVTETSYGKIVSYSMPDLYPVFVTGILPDTDAISEEAALTLGKKEIASRLNTTEEKLSGIRVYFGYINLADEETAHAKLNEHVWVIRAEQNTYALLAPSGETIFVGETK